MNVFPLYFECTFPFEWHINVQHYLEQCRVYFTCSSSQMPLAAELLPWGVSCNSKNAFILKKGDNITVKFTGYWCHSSAAHLENLLVEDAAVFVFSGNRRSINMTSFATWLPIGQNMFLHISIHRDIIDTLIAVRRLLPFIMCNLVSGRLTVISSCMQPSVWSSLSRLACYSTNDVNRSSEPKGKWLVLKWHCVFFFCTITVS